MNTEPTEPTDIPAATARILALAQKLRQRLLNEIAAAPKTKPCPEHGGICHLDADSSQARGIIVYTCDACLTRERRAKEDRLRDRIGIPSDVWHASFENFAIDRQPDHEASCKPIQMTTAARRLILGEIRNLILAGPPGIGKGHIAAAILNSRIATKFITTASQAKWATAHNLFQAVHASYAWSGPQAVIDYYVRKTWLVLDECAMADLPKDGQRVLYDIIDRRQKRKNSKLILLTNTTAPALKAWLSAPVVDRLRSGGLNFLWGSWPSARGTEIDGAIKHNEF